MTLIRADALDLLDHVQPGTAQCCVTSPPYLQQRRYGHDHRELGTENTLDDYVAWLTIALNRVRHALRPDGLLWLNLGDKANGSGGAGGDWNPDRKRRAPGGGPGKFTDPAYLEGGHLDVPGAVLRHLLLDGWRLRLPIIWDKGRQAPEDLAHVGRPRWQHEVIYLLAPGPARPRFYPSGLVETGSIWRFPPGGSGDPHLAPFPDELARRCILPSTLPGDLVIDPFAGSGTTLRVAEQLGRRAIGTDLYAGLPISIPHDGTTSDRRRAAHLVDAPDNPADHDATAEIAHPADDGPVHLGRSALLDDQVLAHHPVEPQITASPHRQRAGHHPGEVQEPLDPPVPIGLPRFHDTNRRPLEETTR